MNDMNKRKPHPCALSSEKLLRDCNVRRGRASGPGGQHRNKVETAIVITHQPTGVKGEATERRSQEQNRVKALFRLRINLALNVRSKEGETAAEPSQLWQSRLTGGRISINPSHDDFPALLAEALDVLQSHESNLPAAAKSLGCSTSQLTKFFKLEPHAFERINRQRVEAGLRPLR